MRIWQKTHLNSPVSFYGIEIPFWHVKKATGFHQPALLLLILLPHTYIIQCIQPYLHLSVKHQPHILHRVLNRHCIHLSLGIGRGPKTTLPLPTIQTYDAVSIIMNHIHRIILLVVKSSWLIVLIQIKLMYSFAHNSNLPLTISNYNVTF